MRILFSVLSLLVVCTTAHAGDAKIKRVVNRTLKCPSAKSLIVTPLEGFENAFVVEGCGKQVFTYRRKAYMASDQTLRSRLPFDLDCEEVHVQYLDKATRGVTGCGRRATYTLVPYTGWVMNAASE